MKRVLMTAAESVAPPSGWSFHYAVPEHPGTKIYATGPTPQSVVAFLVNWRTNNNLPPNADDVWQVANHIWCARAPSRCPGWEASNAPAIAGAGRRILRPLDYGPWLWQYFNTFGVVFDKGRFLAAVDQARAMLDPQQDAGCALCYNHFAHALRDYPPQKVTNRQAAAVWVWTVHNLANDHAEHPRQSFSSIARRFGWEPLTDAEVLNLQAALQ